MRPVICVSKEKFWCSLIFFCFYKLCAAFLTKIARAACCRRSRLMLSCVWSWCCWKPYFRAAKYDAAGCEHRSFVNMLVGSTNFTFPAFPVLSGYRNEFRGAKVYYFSRILTCARLTFFLSSRSLVERMLARHFRVIISWTKSLVSNLFLRLGWAGATYEVSIRAYDI